MQHKLPGLHLRPVSFEPTSGKWQKSVCHGFQIHVTQRQVYHPYESSLILLQSIIRHHKKEFLFKEPPYEYEFKRLPMDLILGDKELRLKLESDLSITEIEADWQMELQAFDKNRAKYFLYR